MTECETNTHTHASQILVCVCSMNCKSNTFNYIRPILFGFVFKFQSKRNDVLGLGARSVRFFILQFCNSLSSPKKKLTKFVFKLYCVLIEELDLDDKKKSGIAW